MADDSKDYVCTLDEAALLKAKEELNEDPKERLSAVNTLRQWVLSQPHICCPTDTAFLLAFLRSRKFSQLESRRQLEDYCVMKTKHKEWFADVDPLEPGIHAVFKEGFTAMLPKRDKEGRRIFLSCNSRIQPWSGRYTKLDLMRTYICLTYYMFFTDELTQVHGVCGINDMTGMTMRHATIMSIDDQKTFFNGWNRCIPARFKKMFMYNVGSLGDFMFMVLRIAAPEKIQRRIVNCGSSLENLYKEVPMELLPEEYLPDDYTGPTVGTHQQLIDAMLADLSSPRVRDRIRHLSSARFGVDESKRPAEVAVQASFRKLNVD